MTGRDSLLFHHEAKPPYVEICHILDAPARLNIASLIMFNLKKLPSKATKKWANLLCHTWLTFKNTPIFYDFIARVQLVKNTPKTFVEVIQYVSLSPCAFMYPNFWAFMYMYIRANIFGLLSKYWLTGNDISEF